MASPEDRTSPSAGESNLAEKGFVERRGVTSAADAAARADSDAPAASGKTGLSGATPGQSNLSQVAIKLTLRDDSICVLTFDRPGSSANVFDRRTLDELNEHLNFVARNPQLKGLLITSAKDSIFIAGADLHAMSEGVRTDDLRQMIESGQSLFNRLAALPIPTVAAIHGAALGGGYEICLACDYRVASLDRLTKIGLPETQLGLLPAWGGSTRLPRLVGLPKALDVILAGKTLAAKQAMKYGLVDELVPREYLVDMACRKIAQGKPRRSNKGLLNNAFLARVLAARLRSQLFEKTRGHYPAVLKALEVVTQGVGKPLAVSLDLEREAILQLVQTEACRNLIRVFLMQERAKKLSLAGAGSRLSPSASAERVVEGPARSAAGKAGANLKSALPIKRTAVIGAGVMGAGIAQWLSARQLPVILRDITVEQVGKGMASIARLYEEGVRRHHFTRLEARQGLDRISPAPSEVPLRKVDLVIEAAVENLELKKKLFQRVDELIGPDTLLATNTSALPVSEIAAATHTPERVLGLHFFNPVHRMQLVEVIAARQTAPEILERGLRFVQQIGKLPVLVKDSPGFLVNRILMPYLVEAGNLVDSGAGVRQIDEAMLDFGMPMGPLRLLDEVGVDVALHVAETLAVPFGSRLKRPPVLGKMVEAGLLGRKSGRGFYLHDNSKQTKLNPQIGLFIQDHATQVFSREELQQRMVLLMVNEAALCLDEGIAAEPTDIDFAMIMGTGFAPFRGGPLQYADAAGAAKLVGAMNHLVDLGGSHFEPCALLQSLATDGRKFYEERKTSL